ncbi:MAG TPA: hypothetical protein PLN69_10120 [bacterium]|nr:hypothetical protein [bacterium]
MRLDVPLMYRYDRFSDWWFDIYRSSDIKEAMWGLEKTGLPLLSWTPGGGYFPSGDGDDPGIFYFIPGIAKWFGLSQQQAAFVFCNLYILICLAAGFAGLMLLARNRAGRVAAVVATLVMALILYKVRVTYVFAAVPFGVAPLLIYFMREKKFGPGFALFALCAGVAAGLASALRVQSGVPVMIFVLVASALSRRLTALQKLGVAGISIMGLLVVMSFFGMLINQRDLFIEKHAPWNARKAEQHVLWHTIHCGLGYISNDLGFEWRDGAAFERAEELAPGTKIYSEEYERVLRGDVMNAVRGHTGFVLKNVFVKFLVVAGFIVLFAGAGLVSFFLCPKQWNLEAAFWIAVAFSSLYGLLAVPYLRYLTGCVSLLIVYSALGINSLYSRSR